MVTRRARNAAAGAGRQDLGASKTASRFYKKKVRDPYAYALESAKKLNQKQPATTA
jgi:hypothetical protein